MKTHLSPRQLADAIGVSESSVKRWSDRGLIPTERTAGGHRRLPVGGVIQFLRSSDLSLVQPEILGLPEAAAGEEAAGAEPVGDDAIGDVVAALVEGSEEKLRAAVFRRYVDGWTAAEVCDRALAPAFERLGERWQHGELEVYEERRGVEVCRQVLHELRQAVAAPGDGAPRAVGGTLAGDWYNLPTAMIEIALREGGWQAQSFGAGHPVETLVAAIEEHRPRLFWLSVSHVGSADELAAGVAELHAAAERHGTALVLGGRALGDTVRRRLRGSAFCDDLRQLQALAAALEPAAARRAGTGEDDDGGAR
ncbi:MAG TPA: cobalamin-dependent protein [Thermoanaerobaculia bacterium]|nr:cobalamin-dependent protein [Thermoanaerobaculia bacterium]